LVLSNEYYEIEITRDTQYALFSSDNKNYDQVVLMEEYNRNDFICAYSVLIHSYMPEFNIALIGRAYGSTESCAILEDNRLVILVDDYLVFLDLISKKVEMKIKIIEYGTGIELYSFDNGYIINGELDIIKVDNYGKKLWEFSGMDIWVRTNGESSIQIINDHLLLIDFEEHNYSIDKWGKQTSIV